MTPSTLKVVCALGAGACWGLALAMVLIAEKVPIRLRWITTIGVSAASICSIFLMHLL